MSNTRPVTLILAATVPQLGIGIKGGLPWRLSQDMKFFRDVTMNGSNKNGIVIMGRKTWESIPLKFRPLKHRTNIIVSSRQLEIPDGVHTASSYENALKIAQGLPAGPIFVIGGGQIYATALKDEHTKHIVLTEISDSSIECDTFFENFPWYPVGGQRPDSSKWVRQPHTALEEFVNQSVPERNTENDLEYSFALWSKM